MLYKNASFPFRNKEITREGGVRWNNYTLETKTYNRQWILRRKQGVEELSWGGRGENCKSSALFLPQDLTVKGHMHEIFDFANFCLCKPIWQRILKILNFFNMHWFSRPAPRPLSRRRLHFKEDPIQFPFWDYFSPIFGAVSLQCARAATLQAEKAEATSAQAKRIRYR